MLVPPFGSLDLDPTNIYNDRRYDHRNRLLMSKQWHQIYKAPFHKIKSNNREHFIRISKHFLPKFLHRSRYMSLAILGRISSKIVFPISVAIPVHYHKQQTTAVNTFPQESQSQKATNCMLWFLWDPKSWQIHKDINWINVCQGLKSSRGNRMRLLMSAE